MSEVDIVDSTEKGGTPAIERVQEHAISPTDYGADDSAKVVVGNQDGILTSSSDGVQSFSLDITRDTLGTAGIIKEVEPTPRSAPYPKIRYQREARPFIVEEVRKAVFGLETIAIDTSNRTGVDLSTLTVKLTHLRKDRLRNPCICIEIKTTPTVHPNQALAYWSALGFAIDDWLPRMDARTRRLFDERLYVSVEWTEPDAIPS